jgi:hypothetical protein
MTGTQENNLVARAPDRALRASSMNFERVDSIALEPVESTNRLGPATL